MRTITSLALAAILMTSLTAHAEEGLDNVYGDFRLRLETVDQDNALRDAKAFTLRSRLGYATESYAGFSARVEVENNAALIDDYNDTNGNGAEFSVVPDPEFTELDQGFIQYQQDKLTLKLGRQVLTYDNHRFIGHVGWRQDRQTFDALSLSYQASDKLALNAAYIDKRNRIFANEKDLDAKDVLLNAAYQSSLGKVTAYAYLLEVDNNSPNSSNNSLDTYGLRYSHKTAFGDVPLSYNLEFASQSNKIAATDQESEYWLAEVAGQFAVVKATLGYERLGSDKGQGAFMTPLATGHKFNGWADQYLATPNQGLVDMYISLGGKAAGGKWLLAYHDYSADKASAAVDDLGSEINALYARQLGQGFSGGVKYAAFNAADIKVDTNKLWLWLGYRF